MKLFLFLNNEFHKQRLRIHNVSLQTFTIVHRTIKYLQHVKSNVRCQCISVPLVDMLSMYVKQQ